MTKKLITDTLKSAVEEQMAMEMYNSSLYLYTSSYFNSKGCKNLAKMFFGQYEEEKGHSLILFDLLNDLGEFVDIPAVDGCAMEFPNLKYVADLYLTTEFETTNSLYSLKLLAVQEKNPVVEERIKEMLKLQQKEYEEATDFNDKASAMNEDWGKIVLWDLSLGS